MMYPRFLQFQTSKNAFISAESMWTALMWFWRFRVVFLRYFTVFPYIKGGHSWLTPGTIQMPFLGSVRIIMTRQHLTNTLLLNSSYITHRLWMRIGMKKCPDCTDCTELLFNYILNFTSLKNNYMIVFSLSMTSWIAPCCHYMWK